MEYLKNHNVRILPWIAKGADMSPIENVFKQLKSMIRKHAEFIHTQEALWDYITQEAFSENMTGFIQD